MTDEGIMQLEKRLAEYLRRDSAAHNEIHEALGGLRKDIQDHASDTRLTAKAVARIDRELFGNGSPGLVKAVTGMAVQLRVGTWLVATLGTATLVALVALLIETMARTNGQS